MQRRNSPSILLYSFGLALALSLLFNGFLLYEQSRQRSLTEYELGDLFHPAEQAVWQRHLSDCLRANQQKDSLIRRLEPMPNSPPGQPVSLEHTPSK